MSYNLIWKHILITQIFLTICVLDIYATPQIHDKLIYKGDTLYVYLHLPDEFYKPDTVRIDSFVYVNRELNINLFGGKESCVSTACGNGYSCTWEIIDNQLYLTGIYSCCYDNDSIQADLNLLFKERFIDGKVKATWIDGNFTSRKGERLFYDHDLFDGGIFEYDLELNFEKGILKNTYLYDNRKSRLSEYSTNSEKLQKHIYSNINWDIIPKQDSTIRVWVEFSSNIEGIIDEVKVRKGYNELYNQEAIRVIKSIPEWNIYLVKGKLLRQKWTIAVVFSEERRNKFKK